MQQIDNQGMAAQPVQHRHISPGKELFVQLPLIQKPEQEIARHKQEKPGQQGEIICGEEAAGWEAQIGRQRIPVKGRRQGADHPAFKAQRAGIHVPQQHKQTEAYCQPGGCRKLFCQLFHRNHQQHATADAGQDTENDAAFRHGDAGHRRDDQTADEHRQPPLQVVPAEAPAETGKGNEGPADPLLPEVAGCAGVPVKPDAEQVHQIPQAVEGDHIEKGEAPEPFRHPSVAGVLP